MAEAILVFGKAEVEGNVRMDLVETANAAKNQKCPGLRLGRRAGHCVVDSSSRIHLDMLVALA